MVTLFLVVSECATDTPENNETQIFGCVSIVFRAGNAISAARDVFNSNAFASVSSESVFLVFGRVYHTSKVSNAL